MNKLIKNSFATITPQSSISLILLVLRVVSGIFMLTHGMGKLLKLFGEAPLQFSDPLGVGVLMSLVLVVFSEVFCSIFLIIGFATRFSAVSLLITMLVAAFIVHANDGFGKQELPLLYASIFLVIGMAGAGKLSVDNWIYSKFK